MNALLALQAVPVKHGSVSSDSLPGAALDAGAVNDAMDEIAGGLFLEPKFTSHGGLCLTAATQLYTYACMTAVHLNSCCAVQQTHAVRDLSTLKPENK